MKKIVILIALIFSCVFVNAQKYDYRFKLENVENLAEAKMATDFLRSIFKT